MQWNIRKAISTPATAWTDLEGTMRSDQHPEVPLTRGLRKSQTHRDGKEMGEGGAGTGRGGGGGEGA